jgi:transcriptional regulator
MYLPKHFDTKDNERILEIIDAYSFATVMSFDVENQPFFSHIPLVVKKTPSGFCLLGHAAKRNPQWSHFQRNPKVKVIINGPHTYITQKWYRSARDVPTWNYVAIHIDGSAKLIEDFDGLVNLLIILTEKFEAGSQSPWEFELPDDLLTPDTLCSAIVGFEISVENIDAKFKLSQNRVDVDKVGIVEGLAQRHDDMSKAVLQLMKDQK